MDDFDELLEEDDALDCILLEEMSKDKKKKFQDNNLNNGCLGVLVILIGVLTVMSLAITKILIL